MPAWFLSALTALILWGLWAFFPKLSLKYISPASSVFFEAVGVFVVGLLVAWRLGGGIEFHPRGALFAVLTGVFGTIGLYFFFSAVKEGPISVISAITALYPLVTVILAALFLGERLGIQQMLGIFFALVAAFLLSWSPEG